MGPYVLRRLLLIVPTLVGVSLVVFFTIKLLPGDPSRRCSARAPRRPTAPR